MFTSTAPSRRPSRRRSSRCHVDGSAGALQADDVGARQQLVQRAPLDAKVRCLGLAEIQIRMRAREVEGPQQLDHPAANPRGAHHPDGLGVVADLRVLGDRSIGARGGRDSRGRPAARPCWRAGSRPACTPPPADGVRRRRRWRRRCRAPSRRASHGPSRCRRRPRSPAAAERRRGPRVTGGQPQPVSRISAGSSAARAAGEANSEKTVSGPTSATSQGSRASSREQALTRHRGRGGI